jgi:hypothetical protein
VCVNEARQYVSVRTQLDVDLARDSPVLHPFQIGSRLLRSCRFEVHDEIMLIDDLILEVSSWREVLATEEEQER